METTAEPRRPLSELNTPQPSSSSLSRKLSPTPSATTTPTTTTTTTTTASAAPVRRATSGKLGMPMRVPLAERDLTGGVRAVPAENSTDGAATATSTSTSTSSSAASTMSSPPPAAAPLSTAAAALPLPAPMAVEQQKPAQPAQIAAEPVVMKAAAPKDVAMKKSITVKANTYTVLAQIGRGGSSKVYRVMTPDGEIRAVKCVDLSTADTDNQFARECYINEIRLLVQLRSNEHVVKLLDAEVVDAQKVIHLVMECGDVDLYHLLQKRAGKPFDESFVRFYWKQMLAAVHSIHEMKILHTDLKPANFLLVQGVLKLIDFGIAITIQNDTTGFVREQQVGTPNYMAPEALLPNSAKPVCRATDVWSLGCILFEVVYGATPFASLVNKAHKIAAICNPAHAIVFKPVRNPHLLDVMQSCLLREASQRPTIPALLAHDFLEP